MMITMDIKGRSITGFLGIISILIVLCVVSFSGCGQSEATSLEMRPDIIEIDAVLSAGDTTRPAVLFPHDMHTDGIAEQGKDCSRCHLKDTDNQFSTKYMRLSDDRGQSVIDLYHDNCITCHNERKSANMSSGPVVCGECHRGEPIMVSSRQQMGFDYSLHNRHETENNSDCSLCHHVYDEEKKELVYIKGQETSCRFCHLPQAVDNVLSMRQVSHQYCVSCHLGKDKGPQNCAGCHDKKMQMAIKTIEDPPRINRNQPDFVLLSVAAPDLESGKLNTVPFAHDAHERFTNTCRDCHHNSLKACKDCHTLAGNELGEGITLRRAMHDLSSDHSCVGCHEKQKSELECSGCHSLMEQGRLSEYACTVCHTGPSPADLASVNSHYRSLDAFRPEPASVKMSFSDDDIPDTTIIGILSDKYEPVSMAHKKHIERLMTNIESSKLAGHFHRHEDVICQGCHHNSPVGEKPPRCASCHNIQFDETHLPELRLQGAYHQQCFGCHQSMKNEQTSDCVKCHAEKSISDGVTSPDRFDEGVINE